MITPDYVRQMARYNRWQNQSLFREAALMSAAEREADRGAFWKSIRGTLSHLAWGDSIWMSRFAGWEKPGGIRDSANWLGWEELAALRPDLDARILAWADALAPEDLAGDLTWYSGAMQAELTRPKPLLIMQFFNHQTHHRGQVHAMLTAAGRRPDDTDIPFGPPEALL
jgi:uncharacterized damage-inducible protein DinB